MIMITEIVYTWPDGREEVRYRRYANTKEARNLIKQVRNLWKMHGKKNSPYSFRNVELTKTLARLI